MYPHIGFFGKMTYLRICIDPIPIRVSVSVLHSRPNQSAHNKSDLPLAEISSSSMGRTGRGYGGTLGLPAMCTGGLDEESETFSCINK